MSKISRRSRRSNESSGSYTIEALCTFLNINQQRSLLKKNRLNGQNTKKLRKGVIRFLILAGIVVSVIPVVYFSDNVYRLASNETRIA